LLEQPAGHRANGIGRLGEVLHDAGRTVCRGERLLGQGARAGAAQRRRGFVDDASEDVVGRARIRGDDGTPIEGYTLADCPEVYGDRIDQVVQWKSGSSVGSLAGRPVRLRFVMSDADLFSFRFREP